MIYFDTSYIVKCYLNEAGSAPVRRLAEASQGMGCSLHGPRGILDGGETQRERTPDLG